MAVTHTYEHGTCVHVHTHIVAKDRTGTEYPSG